MANEEHSNVRDVTVLRATESVPTPKPPPHPLDGEWFMHADGQSYGPFTGHQMRDFVKDGRLSRDSEVIRSGSDTWTKAGEDKALALLFPSNIPAPALRAGGSSADSAAGLVSAAPGATIVQVTNNLASEPKPTIILEGGEAKPKSAGTALVLSLLIVGLGQFYNGQIGKGLLMMFGCILLWIVMLGWIINIWSMIDAYQTAKAMNNRYQRRLAAGAII